MWQIDFLVPFLHSSLSPRSLQCNATVPLTWEIHKGLLLCTFTFSLAIHMTYFGPWDSSRCDTNMGLQCAHLVGYALWHFCLCHAKSFSQGGAMPSIWNPEWDMDQTRASWIHNLKQRCSAKPSLRSVNSQLADHRWVKINALYWLLWRFCGCF